MIGEAVEGFSEIRWWCKAMIMMQTARAFPKLKPFLDKSVQENVGDATTKTMLEIYTKNTLKLKLQLTAMLDMRKVVSITHTLEGDGAVILQAFSLIEEIRHLGSSLTQVGSLPNVEAVLRAEAKLEKGLSICKVFPGHGACYGKVVDIDKVDSTLYPGTERTAYTILYSGDGHKEDLKVEEIRPLINLADSVLREQIVDGLTPGFKYLSDRLLGNCASNYSCKDTYTLFRLAQTADPTFAASMLTVSMIDELACILFFSDMHPRVPQHRSSLVEQRGARPQRHGRLHREGALASMEPSSAAVEHFFSLCNHMFGDFPAERAGRLRARLAHAAREHAIPPLGLNVLFLGRGRIYGDCQPCGPQFVCGGHLYYMHMHMCLKGCPRGLLVKKWLETSFLFSEIP